MFCPSSTGVGLPWGSDPTFSSASVPSLLRSPTPTETLYDGPSRGPFLRTSYSSRKRSYVPPLAGGQVSLTTRFRPTLRPLTLLSVPHDATLHPDRPTRRAPT